MRVPSSVSGVFGSIRIASKRGVRNAENKKEIYRMDMSGSNVSRASGVSL